jgi:hypothetical protein
MDFEIPEDHRMIKDVVARFVKEALIPLEPELLRREAAGQGIGLTADERAKVDALSTSVVMTCR